MLNSITRLLNFCPIYTQTMLQPHLLFTLLSFPNILCSIAKKLEIWNFTNTLYLHSDTFRHLLTPSQGKGYLLDKFYSGQMFMLDMARFFWFFGANSISSRYLWSCI